jgi:hypothetical protein
MTENEFGTVVYQDGWHYTVKVDEDDKARRVAIAQASLDFQTKRGTPDEIAEAQAVLDDVQAHSHQVPDQRLVLEDNEDGSLSRYRLATEADTRSWHDRKGKRAVGIVLTAPDGEQVQVDADEMAAIQALLDERRGV